MTNKTINIGTRGSKLALYQAHVVQDLFHHQFPGISTNIVIIKTKGDIILDSALSKIGDKGLFTKELEMALVDNTIDVAVNSLKDMPTELPEKLKLGAVLERADVADALVSIGHKKLNELDNTSKIATSSLRRKASLLKYNPEFTIVDIRGNVNSRLKKMENGHCDAMIMASAGLKRLGLEKYITEILPVDTFIPAVGQGAIAIESRKDDEEIDSFLNIINHKKTWIAAEAERAFMHTLEGGCQVPVGCYSSIKSDQITLTGFIASPDGKKYLKKLLSGTLKEAETTGINLAKQLLDLGGLEILNKIKKQT